VFVRRDWRSTDTEGMLRALAISLFKASKEHREISLYVGAGSYALEVVEELRGIGFRDAFLRMEAVHEEDGVPADRVLN
jgi:hypothetical protein